MALASAAGALHGDGATRRNETLYDSRRERKKSSRHSSARITTTSSVNISQNSLFPCSCLIDMRACEEKNHERVVSSVDDGLQFSSHKSIVEVIAPNTSGLEIRTVQKKQPLVVLASSSPTFSTFE